MRAAMIVAGMAALGLSGCTDAQGAREAAEAYGLTNVQATGYEIFGCSQHDTLHTGFRATNARGQQVEGVVCADYGPFGKASTVRIFRLSPTPSDVSLAQ